MELPHLGEHCQEPTCKILDFLPFRCDSCKKIYCKDHFHYTQHSCDQTGLKIKDFQVPLCPLCNQPVPYKRNELPDVAMSAHIDRDCNSDPAEERRKIFTNKCFLKGCKHKELIPFNCNKCKKNYCLRHRHETDHDCDTIVTETSRPSSSRSNDINSKRLIFFQKQEKKPQASQKAPIQPSSMTDNQALEYAIQQSLKESQKKSSGKNEALTEDEQLALALAESEREYNQQRSNSDSQKESCLLI
ncbi:AN1-type zinc finger 2B isoform X1 [Brachionus plicatilis]|uniref:AN1-type zinc finger 2B isoform X1 n=1 Tax=Brachionus plicatilis TaxID=10195 RepID=A0A3M7P613_BRAPC|nr:AN1-type zinc finger 2B isoform X1 [Brachionus plicatilis]